MICPRPETRDPLSSDLFTWGIEAFISGDTNATQKKGNIHVFAKNQMHSNICR